MYRICSTRILSLAIIALLLLLVSISCDDNPVDEDELGKLRISIYSGNNQTERVGARLAMPLVVQIDDVLGNPQAGVRVAFSTMNPGAAVTPDTSLTNSLGFASCRFQLGTEPGVQNVKAVFEDDSTMFTATAVAIACPEEDPARSDDWPPGDIYITTTSSSFLAGTGSVLIKFDPVSKEITKVLETDETLIDLAFSDHGELFVTTNERIFKVNPSSLQLEEFGTYPVQWNAELVANGSGILAGLTLSDIFMVQCPPTLVTSIYSLEFFTVNEECLAAHPMTRDLFVVRGTVPSFQIYRAPWDGRATSIDELERFTDTFNAVAAVPRGMSIDSTGTLFITFDTTSGYGNFRRIVSVSSLGEVDDDFFDFYAHAGGNSQEAGRWGDIAAMDGKLYLIDTRNDRLVVISGDGQWEEEIADQAFSETWVETERYGIAASTE
jgi:hypothetical protein